MYEHLSRGNTRNRRLHSVMLILDWSPKQISGWLKRKYSEDQSLRVSHETIYRSLFIQARGALKKALIKHLRSKRRIRRSRHASIHGHSQAGSSMPFPSVEALSGETRNHLAVPEDSSTHPQVCRSTRSCPIYLFSRSAPTKHHSAWRSPRVEARTAYEPSHSCPYPPAKGIANTQAHNPEAQEEVVQVA
jgi:hypothetical protein